MRKFNTFLLEGSTFNLPSEAFLCLFYFLFVKESYLFYFEKDYFFRLDFDSYFLETFFSFRFFLADLFCYFNKLFF